MKYGVRFMPAPRISLARPETETILFPRGFLTRFASACEAAQKTVIEDLLRKLGQCGDTICLFVAVLVRIHDWTGRNLLHRSGLLRFRGKSADSANICGRTIFEVKNSLKRK